VLLTEGSVTIRSKDGKEIKMVPGELVEINGTEEPAKKIANGDSILAWKDNMLFFDKTPLPEAAKIISDHYGVKVSLASEELQHDSLSGIMQNNNLDMLLNLLETGKGYKITRKEGEIIIAKP